MRTDRPETAGGGFRAGGSRGRVGSSTYGTSVPKPKPAPKGMSMKKKIAAAERILSSPNLRDPLKGTTAGKMRRQERWSMADFYKSNTDPSKYYQKSFKESAQRVKKATSIKKMNKTQSMLEKKEDPHNYYATNKANARKSDARGISRINNSTVTSKGFKRKFGTVTPKKTK